MLPYSFRLCLVVFLAFTLILSLAVFCSAPHVIVPWHLQIKRNKNDFLLPCSVLSGRRPGTEPEWKNCLILHVWLNLERFQRRGLYLQPPSRGTKARNCPPLTMQISAPDPHKLRQWPHIWFIHVQYWANYDIFDIFDILLTFLIFYWYF